LTLIKKEKVAVSVTIYNADKQMTGKRTIMLVSTEYRAEKRGKNIKFLIIKVTMKYNTLALHDLSP